MLFMIAGLFKPTSEERIAELHAELKKQLSQGRMSLAGVLRGRRGKRIGYVGFVEAQGFDDAEAFLKASPFAANKLYARGIIAQFDAEVGSIGK